MTNLTTTTMRSLIPQTRKMQRRLAMALIAVVALATIIGVMVASAEVKLDNHSGLEFTSGGVDYLGLEMLEHEDGVGTIWLAVPKSHDLETGPVTPLIVLAPDAVTPN